MVAEGVEPALIENAAKQLGMPLGPLQLVDETSIDLGVKIAKATKAAMGDAYPESPADDVLFAARRPGPAGAQGEAPASTPTTRRASAPASGRSCASSGRSRADQPALTEVQHRLAMIQTLEAVRALEDGVLTDIREGDVGAILGWGFMPWSGGPFSWLDILGAGQALEICDAPRRRPRRPLRRRRRCCARWRRRGESFYGRARREDAA